MTIRFNKIIAFYFSRIFLQSMFGVFLVCFALILMIDLVEQLRKFSGEDGFSFFIGLQLAFYRAPNFAEQVLPFSILIGAIVGFVILSGKMELIIARSAGLSIWQFIRPPILVALALGLISSLVYNPVAVWLWQKGETLEIETLHQGKRLQSAAQKEIWIRQEGPEGHSILSAKLALNEGKTLINVTAIVFDSNSNFHEQVDALSANWNDGYWMLNKAKVLTPDTPPREQLKYKLPTFLTEKQINNQLEHIENITFWALPNVIETAQKAGFDHNRLQLKYQTLLSRPLLFAAMIIIAATVSLRLIRFGSFSRMILAGIIAGFMLYIISELAGDFAANGLINPIIAGWFPAFIAMILGVTVLLYQEDG